MCEVNLARGQSTSYQFDLFPDWDLSKMSYPSEKQILEVNNRIEGLVARAQNGDQEAFALLYREYVGPIYRYTYLRVRRAEQAEDLTQEVFLRAMSNIRTFHFRKKPFINWLFGIAHNLIIDQYRQSKRHKSIVLDDQLTNTINDPVDTVEKNQEISFVKQAIEGLPPRERKIILFRFGAELSINETANLIGISEGSVKKLQHEAIYNLRKRMERSGQGTETKINGLFLDYDGTISPLNVPRQLSRVPPCLETLLNKMQKFIQIGIITAKDLNFILPRTSFAHAWGAIAGLEIKTGSQLVVAEKVKQGLPSLYQALTYAKQNIKQGSLIEEKGDFNGQPLAFCVDWRQVEDNKETKLMSKRILAYCRKLQLKTVKYPGKPYFDVFSSSINKGYAIKRIKSTLNLSGNILYMGDSSVDNSAFREADISIGVANGKKPQGLNCQYWINFENVPDFLSVLFQNNFTFNPDLPGINLMN